MTRDRGAYVVQERLARVDDRAAQHDHLGIENVEQKRDSAAQVLTSLRQNPLGDRVPFARRRGKRRHI